MSFQHNLRYARKAKGYTQDDLSKILRERGVKAQRSTVNTWETGKHEPTGASLTVIADVLGVTVDYLLGVEAKPDVVKAPKEMADKGIIAINSVFVPDDPIVKASTMVKRFFNSLIKRPEKVQDQAIILGGADEERLDLLCKINEASIEHLVLLAGMAEMSSEEVKNLRILVKLPSTKIKALVTLAGLE